jgi:hypothetical protein
VPELIAEVGREVKEGVVLEAPGFDGCGAATCAKNSGWDALGRRQIASTWLGGTRCDRYLAFSLGVDVGACG